MSETTHVDDWLDAPTIDERELPAKMWLEKFRAPAGCKDEAWLRSHTLCCKYQDKLHRVVGCSRMGDVWLTTKVSKPDGYEKRVSIDACYDWRMEMPGFAVDMDGPWRVTKCHEITGNFIPTIVDCCNRPLFSAHAWRGVLERIVKDHNDALVPFVSPYASELEDDDDDTTS